MPVLGFRCILESQLDSVDWLDITEGVRFGQAVAKDERKNGKPYSLSFCHFPRLPALPDQIFGLTEAKRCGQEDIDRGPDD